MLFFQNLMRSSAACKNDLRLELWFVVFWFCALLHYSSIWASHELHHCNRYNCTEKLGSAFQMGLTTITDKISAFQQRYKHTLIISNGGDKNVHLIESNFNRGSGSFFGGFGTLKQIQLHCCL